MLVEAVDRLVSAFEPLDAAAPLVAALRCLARRLDEDDSDSAMWREYRFMLRDLREAVGNDSSSSLEEEFAKLDG